MKLDLNLLNFKVYKSDLNQAERNSRWSTPAGRWFPLFLVAIGAEDVVLAGWKWSNNELNERHVEVWRQPLILEDYGQ